ncbi:AdoMet-dependent rRNA methyltransferase spb1 [Irineochytrium annulatum]|nr:AdoMet-dependent rRNA methyltransferase spb1 [Irineochytrium annulatum]
MAKEQGYRARSAFKLIQINKKYNILEKSKQHGLTKFRLQVAAKYMPRPSIIIGLDLAPIKPIPGVITHVEDITTSKCRATLKSELKTWKADVVLHDGAPNVGVAWVQDAFTQSELTLSALKLAAEFLVAGGAFVTKVFRSKDYNKLLWVFNQLFEKVEATKPASSRNVSAEIFVVCRGFRAPKKIDPRLLDSKYVFKEVDDGAAEEEDEKKQKERQGALLNDLFHPEKRRRHRDGYADGANVLHVAMSVVDFVKQGDFVSILSRSNTLVFDDSDDSKTIKEHPLTTENILVHFADLRVLGKKDFKELIRWRESIRVALGIEKSREAKRQELKAQEEERKQADANPVETEETIAEELSKQAKALQAQAKREKRRSRERKAKQLLRFRLGMEAPMDIGMEIDGEGVDVFHHGEDSNEMSMPQSAQFPSRAEEVDEYDVEMSHDEEAYDTDEEMAKKIGELDGNLDEMYNVYRERLLNKNPKAVVARRKENGKQAFEDWYGVEWEEKLKGIDAAASYGKAKRKNDDHGSSDDDSSDSDADEVIVNPDANDMSGDLTSEYLSKKAKVFFANPMFENAALSKSSLFTGEMQSIKSDNSDDSDGEDNRGKSSRKKSKTEGSTSSFEVVQAPQVDEEHAASTDFIIDTAAKYTMAEKLIKPSGRRDLIDDAFNRYAFNDPENLPSWFTVDEDRHNKPQLPVTKEAVALIKAKLRALDARPIKKVAEAKFRNKLRADAKIKKAMRKAAAVADDEDTPDASKLKSAAKIMAKAGAQKRKRPTVVVAKHANKRLQGRPKGVKGRYKMVDGKMKKEARQEKARKMRKNKR